MRCHDRTRSSARLGARDGRPAQGSPRVPASPSRPQGVHAVRPRLALRWSECQLVFSTLRGRVQEHQVKMAGSGLLSKRQGTAKLSEAPPNDLTKQKRTPQAEHRPTTSPNKSRTTHKDHPHSPHQPRSSANLTEGRAESGGGRRPSPKATRRRSALDAALRSVTTLRKRGGTQPENADAEGEASRWGTKDPFRRESQSEAALGTTPCPCPPGRWARCC
jgi:hypothetical protein